MSYGFGEWRLSLLTTLGLGAALGCGGNATSDRDLEGLGGNGYQGPRGQAGNGSETGGSGAGGRALIPTAAGVGGALVGGAGAGGTGGSSGGKSVVGPRCENPRGYLPPGTKLLSAAPIPGVERQSQKIVIPPEQTIQGWVECDGGWLHRRSLTTCPSELPRADFTLPEGAQDGECTKDTDCTEKPNGYCVISQPDALPLCAYGCTADSDCDPGSVCVCGNPVGRCAAASCTLDSDCGTGYCAGTPRTSGCGGVWYTFACVQPTDECFLSSDCNGGQECSAGEEGRACVPVPVCGRPFLVAGSARTAPARATNGGWCGSVNPECRGLDAALRAKLAAHYTELGLMEHASVAAFARFILELLSFAAPADLVRDAQRALSDEIAHAELCFGLARAYGGEPISAGVLPVDGALDARSRLEIVKTAILEACIGETIAAVEARLACDGARDPEVRRVLARIAEDEARHAELGWRFLHWTLTTSEPGFAAELRRELETILEEQAPPPVTRLGPTLDLRLMDHGCTSDGTRAQARAVAFSELIGPWARALLTRSVAA